MTEITPGTKLAVFMGAGESAPFWKLIPELEKRNDIEILVVDKSCPPNAKEISPSLSPRTQFLSGLSETQLKEAVEAYFSRPESVGYNHSIQVFVDDSSIQADGSYYKLVESTANATLRKATSNIRGSIEDGMIGLKNSIRNLEVILNQPSLEGAKDLLKGLPAIVVSSGPSLDAEWQNLKEVQDKALIICSASTLKPLLDRGIRPHMVTVIERQEKMKKFFEVTKNLHDIVLVATPVCVPEVFKEYDGPKALLFRPYGYYKIFGLKPEREVGPTAGNMSIQAATLLGCDPIVLVGQDLSYDPKEFRSHVKGTIFSERDAVRSPEDLKREGFVPVRSNSGNSVLASGILIRAKNQIEKDLKKYARKLIHTSADGAVISGAEFRSFESTLSIFNDSSLEMRERILKSIKSLPVLNTSKAAIEQSVSQYGFWAKEVSQKIRGLIETIEKNRQNKDVESIKSLAKRVDEVYVQFVNTSKEFSTLLGIVFTPDLYRIETEKNRLAQAFGYEETYCRQSLVLYEDFFKKLESTLKEISEFLSQEKGL